MSRALKREKEEQEIKEEGTFHAHTSLLNQMEIIVVPLAGRQTVDSTGQSIEHARQDEVPHCAVCCPHSTHSIEGQFRFRQSPVALIKVLMHPTDCSDSPTPPLLLLLLLGFLYYE